MSVCPRCGKEARDASAAFCAYCGTPMPSVSGPLSAEIQAVLDRVKASEDPKIQHDLLAEAEKQYPDSLEIARELLYLGRLHERNRKKIDFSIIKCHLLHMYLTPKAFGANRKQEMREELFGHPQLLRCQQLAPDADAFTREYLIHLSAQFAGLFLRGSTSYTRTFFGLRVGGRLEKVLAEPACDMLVNIRRDMELDSDQREMLYECFYRGYLSAIGGKEELDKLLNALCQPVPQ